MLLTLVIFYLLITIAIGLWAAKRVKNTADFAIAGRHLPLVMIVTTTFATWFGSETVLGIPAKFVQGGLNSVVEDPFGAGTCLILVGLFFAGRLYKMTLLTISDYYRERFGRVIEVVCSLIIILSYLGWVSAQVTALGLVFNVLSDGAISPPVGMVIGTVSILAYTLFGGMWSVAVTDFMQMIILVLRPVHPGGVRRSAGRRRRQGDRAGDQPGHVPLPPRTELQGGDVLHRGGHHDDAGLDSAAGRVPAGDVGQQRRRRHQRPGDRRRLLHPVCLRADVPRHQRADHHARASRDADQRRPAEGAADAGAREDALRDAGAVLRCAAVGDQIDCIGDVARAVGDLRREHLAPVLPARGRQESCSRCASRC